MESLLKWSIENSTPADPSNPKPAQPRSDLNPEIIDAILGKSDAEQMKDDLTIAVDENRSEDERVDALDHLEMLIEHIDNANSTSYVDVVWKNRTQFLEDLERLKMWEPLHALATSPSSTNPIIMQALWVIGTALQNNPAAQDSYLSLNPLAPLTNLLSPNSKISPQVRSKAIYVLSGLLKHNAIALSKLDDDGAEGWTKLKQGLQDPDISVRRKVAFLLNTLLTPAESICQENRDDLHNPIHANSHAAQLANPDRVQTSPIAKKALQDHGIVSTVIESLTNPTPYGEDGDQEGPDADFEEKSVGLLRTYTVNCEGELTSQQRNDLAQWSQQEKDKHGDTGLAERWSLSSGELKELVDKIQS